MVDATSAESASIESRAEAESGVGGEAKYWQGQLDLSEKDHKDWIKDGKSVIKRYKGTDEKVRASSNNRKFNILFSNTETLKAALFARMAKPDIRRRFADQDPVGRQVAEIVERAAIYCQEADESEKAVEHAIDDYLLPGRGVVRVCYEAETAEGEDKKEYVAKQDLYEEYVAWDDFRHEPAKTWDQVTWEAFRHRMSRDDLKDNFGSEGDDDGKLSAQDIADIPLNWSPDPNDTKISDAFKRAEVWEIFDKTERERIWIVPGFDKVCRTDDDPFGLEGFFPNAEPLQSVVANDTLIPVPEFNIYKDQADGLDEIESRIDRLTRALKRRGVYDATFKELARLAKANDNEFVPVKNYAELSSKGGLAAAFQAEDISMLAKVLGELHTQRDLRKQTIYEVCGIADIMRGATDPQETLGAQKIKTHFGASRLKKRQEKVQKWIRDTLRIKCEIIAEHFEPQKLADMTGFKYIDPVAMQQIMQQQQMAQQPPPQGMPQGGMPGQMNGQPPIQPPPPPPPPIDDIITQDMIKIMRDDKLRSYRIDVETDSTIFEDAEAEKASRVELLKSLSEFVVAWSPIIAQQPHLLPLAFELLAFGVRGFKAGRQLEDVIEQTKNELEDAAKQAAQQPPKPSPEVQAEQAKAAADKQKADLTAQLAQQKAGQTAQLAQQKHQQEMQKMAAQLELQREEMAMVFKKLGMEMLVDQHAAQLGVMQRHHEASLDTRATELAHEHSMEALDRSAEAAQERQQH
jgi:hypothetical protein